MATMKARHARIIRAEFAFVDSLVAEATRPWHGHPSYEWNFDPQPYALRRIPLWARARRARFRQWQWLENHHRSPVTIACGYHWATWFVKVKPGDTFSTFRYRNPERFVHPGRYTWER